VAGRGEKAGWAERLTERHTALRVVAIVLILALPIAYGTTRLGQTADNRVFFSADNPDLKALQQLEHTFSQVNNALIAVEPKDGEVFTSETLGIIRALTDAAWRLPYASRVDSLVNFQRSYAQGDDLVVEDLVPPDLALDEAAIAQRKAAALADPLVVGRLLSPKADVAAVIVNFRLPADSTLAVREIAAAIRKLADDVRAGHPQVRLYLTGQVMIMATFGEATFADLQLLIPAMMGLIVLVAALMLRSLWGTVAVLAVSVLSTIFALGLAGWFRHVLNPATGAAPTIILTLAMADSIHVVAGTLSRLRQGQGRQQAVAGALRESARPIALTAITTAVGFLALNWADSPPLNQVGTIVGVGVLIAAALAVVFLPALLSTLPLRPSHRSALLAHRESMYARLAGFIILHRREALIASGVITLVAAVGITRIELNDNWLKYFDERFEFRRDTDFVQARLTGVEVLEYVLPAGGEGKITDPGYLKAVDGFATWLRAQPAVRNVAAVSDIVKRINKNMHGGDEAHGVVPDSAALNAQYLLLYELSLPFGLDLTDQIDIARSATRLTAALEERTTGELQAFVDQAAVAWLSQTPPAVSTAGEGVKPTGISMMFAHISERSIRSMLLGTAVSFIIVSGLLLVAFRSWRLGLLSLVPNLLPPIIGFGLWGFLSGQIGLAAALVTSMTFGIVVDDTTHLLSHYRDARVRLGLGAEAAIRHAFGAIGGAMTATTVILVAGFLLLGLSGFEVNRTLGLLTGLTLLCAYVADWLLMPPLLRRFDK
jgi:uncharacterized protein